jgi:hypothetical protein
MVITSANQVSLKEYQMKLSIEFQKLMKQTAMDNDDMNMVANDETHVNSNLKGNQSHGRLQISTNAMAP